jgi:tetratricopeptide (TPR) repeat protein
VKSIVFVLAALSLSSLWQQMSQPTNSKVATERGVSAYDRKQYGNAAYEFGTAAASRPTPQNLFNLGTAQVAAGQRTEGAATLAKAMAEPALRAKSFYNRGNGALAANAYDHAIRDYTEALKLTPRDADAKRNLEIALRRKQSAQQQQQSGGQNQQQKGPAPQPPPTPEQAPDQGRQEPGEADAESLLRSVQQQEQEELARMKKARGDSRRVGW